MFRSMKIVLLVIAAIFCSSVSANSPFSTTTINGITVHDHGNVIIIRLADNVSNGEGCSINNQLVVEKTHPFFKEMYSALLSAFHTGTKIHGWVKTCYSWDMPILTRLDMKK